MLARVQVGGVVFPDHCSEASLERADEVAVLIYVAGGVTVRGMRRLLIVIALAGLVVGCGGQAARKAETTFADPEAPPNTECVVFLRGSSIAIDVYGAGTATVCRTITRNWSVNGAFWSPNDDYTGNLTRAPVCRLNWRDMVVFTISSVSWDTDSANAFCGGLVNRGAVELPSS